MATARQPLYVGSNKYVAALDPDTGAELWRTSLPHAGGGGPVSILIKGPRLFVGCYGRAYCLDRRDGTLIWENGLPRMGYHAVLLAMEGAVGTPLHDVATAAVRRQRDEAAGNAAAGAAS